ncbi:sperm-associated antigen 1 isoform X2 [Esox lucius]|uniref:RNA-polymerase II-associated protein 3-like C-terminal domain-containing protein n=1 Tax=Esox lucius TaxID=8010 RepID=A0A3P8XGH1_ESOLU|nr:sperm-associated antigen 1 isoform X2 [Esox lucius]
MSTEMVSSLLNQEPVDSSTGSTGRGAVPVDHLDYGYIEKCTDAKYLGKILTVLRSGEEGIYPHLIEFCESHLEKLDPKSRALRKENPPATAFSFSRDEWLEITDELEKWEKNVKMSEKELKQQSLFHDTENENVPPVRGSGCSIPSSQNAASRREKTTARKIVPRDYKEWDMFDVDKECDKIDGNETKKDAPTVINSGHPKIRSKMDTTALSQQEKVIVASREKDKGNEAFKANDYEEAVAYYTRSLSVVPTVAAHNNRAQAEIRLQRWHNALSDCQAVLEMESGNMKALLRRATVLKQQGNYQKAAEDLRNVLQAEPQNATATGLLVEVDKKLNECQPEKEQKSKKILIQELEDEVNNEDDDARPVEPSQAVGGESAAVAPTERGVMGNTQKKPHGRAGNGGPSPHADHDSHGGPRRGRGCNADKYKVNQQESTASDKVLSNGAQGSGRSGSMGAEPAGKDGSNLDAPCGALPPPLARMKNEGNLLFKNGQFADALGKYSQAITGLTDSGVDSPEDLCILYSNRAACYLKDGNSSDCIQDCTRALELHPFSLKPLLRRAMAYETMERYRQAYVDYKTVLQVDIGVQAAHDSVNRITRLLIDQDGEQWREKLPEIPLVPLSAQQHRREEPPSAEALQARAEKAKQDAARKAEMRFNSLKQEGNEFVKKAQFQEALEKYSECLKLKPEECPIYTNRALCFLKLERFAEAKQDCDSALKLEPTNKKAFYRRALANKGLKDYMACSSDLQEVLQQDPNVAEAEKELEEVTLLLRQSLAQASPSNKHRRTVPITEVEGPDDGAEAARSKAEKGGAEPSLAAAENHCRGEDALTTNLQPTNACQFNQSLSAARLRPDLLAGAQLLRHVPPETVPVYVGNQLDGHTLSFIIQVLDTQLLEEEPHLVYQHLNHLHTTDRFSVVLMLLGEEQRAQMTRLFERLSTVDSGAFSRNDVQNLANKYI